MKTERLDPKAIKKTSGAAWERLHPKFALVSDILLDVSKSATGKLTTIYIKYSSPETQGDPYGVVWVKKASEIVVGLSLPPNISHERLCDPPQGYIYAGLTKYVVIDADNDVPTEFESWAAAAYTVRSGGTT